MLSKQRVLCLVSRVRRRSFGPNARQEMSKFVLLAAAFATGASVALSLKVAPVDTLKSARIRAKARLREALAVDDKVSNPDAMTSVKTHNESIDDVVATDRRSRRRLAADVGLELCDGGRGAQRRRGDAPGADRRRRGRQQDER